MTVLQSFALLPPQGSDRELNEAWLCLGLYKLRLRQSAFHKHKKPRLREILPELRKANRKIDELWDEILFRQANPSYVRKAVQGRSSQPPDWNNAYNPLRWDLSRMIH